MEFRALGETGLSVPAVGMGTWKTFDVRTEAEISERRAVLDAAIESGATLVDSSPMYGESERVLGLALEGRRDRCLVATKVWSETPEIGDKQIAASLGFFGGRVDIYQVHNLVAWRHWVPVLERMRDAGTVRVVGATHYKHDAYPELLELVRARRVQQIQIPYNAGDRLAARELLPAAHDNGIGVLVMRPLGEGKLMRRVPSAEELKPLEPFGVRTWAQALLKWILSDDRVHCAIPATRSAERMRENAEAGAPPWLDAEARRYVEMLASR